MKPYVITTGTVFGLLTVVHIWRAVEEGSHVAKDPWYVLITAVAATLSLWAFGLVVRSPRA
jgi:hypothetical protein